MKLKKSQEKGITLIALVITIIILLILAGVTLRLVFHDLIIKRAQSSADLWKEKQDNEIEILNELEKELNKYGKKDEEQEEINKITITANVTTARNTLKTETQNGIETGPIIVTINYGKTDLQKQYKKETDDDWTNVEQSSIEVEVKENVVILARYYDGVKEYNTERYSVANVDNVAPTITNDETSVVNLSISGAKITINATFEDAADSGSVVSGIKEKLYSIDGTSYQTSNEFTVYNGGYYMMYIKATDYAGNECKISFEVPVGYELDSRITFNGASGSGGTLPLYLEGEEVTVSVPTSVPSNYRFTGWYSDNRRCRFTFKRLDLYFYYAR